MADAVQEAIAGENSVYNSGAWSAKREEYQGYWNIFDGSEWRETTGAPDPDTGRAILRYPLQINPAAKLCRVHRAVLFGVREDTSALPVKTLVSTDGGGTRDEQLQFQKFVNGTWRCSQGTSILEEAGLLLQIYGGHFFKVAWEFWNTSLPNRIAVRSLKSPGWCWPVYDIYDPFHLLEAYIGYRIPASVARAKYGITVSSEREDVLYMEHWTKDAWRTTVDGQVPSMQIGDGEPQALAGKNPWGLVPIVYIPHERSGGFYGKSLIANGSGLARELNARTADIGDAVREVTHRLLAMRNTRARGAIKTRKILSSGRAVCEAVDLGDAPTITGAKEPHMFAVDNNGIPETVAEFPAALWKEIKRDADVADIAMGDGDISGGRITGPVTAWRMYPSLSHSMTERAFFSTGLNMIAEIIGVIALERMKAGAYQKLGIADPKIAPSITEMKIKQVWYPSVPVEDVYKIQSLTLRLQSKGISLHTYLERLGEDDINQEIERIWEDYKREAEIEATIKAKVEKERGMSTNPNNFAAREENDAAAL